MSSFLHSLASASDMRCPLRRLCAVGLVLALLEGCATAPAPVPVEQTVEKVPDSVIAETVDLASIAIDQGRYSDAKVLLERVLLVDPENPRAHLNLAEVRMAEGEVGKANGVFASLTENEQVGPLALQGEGISLVLLGDAKRAVEKLRAAVEADDGLWRAWNALAAYHDSRSEWTEASKCYDMALAARPDDAFLYNNRGFSMMLRGSYNEAISDFAMSLRLDPDLEIARRNLRLALAWKGEYVRALSGVTSKERGEILNNIGYIAVLRGDFDKAEAYLTQAMEADAAFNKAAWRNLAYLKDMQAIAEAPQPNTAAAFD